MILGPMEAFRGLKWKESMADSVMELSCPLPPPLLSFSPPVSPPFGLISPLYPHPHCTIPQCSIPTALAPSP